MDEVQRARLHGVLVERLLTGTSREHIHAELLQRLPEVTATECVNDAVADIASRYKNPDFQREIRKTHRRKFGGKYVAVRALAWVFLVLTGIGVLVDLLSGTVTIRLLFLAVAIAVLAFTSSKISLQAREADEAVARLVGVADDATE